MTGKSKLPMGGLSSTPLSVPSTTGSPDQSHAGLLGNAALTSLLGLSSTSSSGAASGTSSGGSSNPTPAPGSGSSGGFLDSTIDWMLGDNGGEAWGDIWDCITGDQPWAPGPTGGFMPQSIADEMAHVGSMVPADAGDNGMHAWHAGTNAMLAEKLGVVGAPLIFAGGLFHETPLDWDSWWAEEEYQGTINHGIDSAMDIVANVVENAIETGNAIPGPGDPDPAFGGGGPYKGNPSDAW